MKQKTLAKILKKKIKILKPRRLTFKDRIKQAREFWERGDRNFEEAQIETERLRENSDNFFFHDDFTYLDV